MASVTNYQKVAIFVSSLPEDQSVGILKSFGPDEIEKICRELLTVSKIDAKTKDEVLQEFRKSYSGSKAGDKSGAGYVENLLVKMYGSKRAASMLHQLSQEKPSEQVNLEDIVVQLGPKTVAEELQGEHPLVVTTVLSSLPPKRSADILAEFSDEMQVEVFKAIALAKTMPPDLAEKAKSGFAEKLAGRKTVKRSIGKEGIQSSAGILVFMPGTKSKKLMEALKTADEELAKNVEAALFSFDDINKIEDREIQKIFGAINQADLKLAMRKCEAQTKEIVFRNMSERASTMLKEDIEMMGPQKKDAIMAAQQRIIAVIRKLEEKGEIKINRGDTGGPAAVSEEEALL